MSHGGSSGDPCTFGFGCGTENVPVGGMYFSKRSGGTSFQSRFQSRELIVVSVSLKKHGISAIKKG